MSTGKTIESLENRDSVKVCRTKHEYLCEISKSTFKKAIIVSPDLVLVTHQRVCVVYNKPFFVGFSILDISKYIMYDYFYNVLRKFYPKPGTLDLLYSDTDSLLLKIKTKDLISDLHSLRRTLDFSNIPLNHPLYDDSKKQKLFHFKEEFGLLPILRMVSLGSKVYAIQLACCHDFSPHKVHTCQNAESENCLVDNVDVDNFTDKIVLKGISKNSRKNLTFNDYLACLKEQCITRVEDYRIQSKKQRISSSLIHKVALTSFCDKVKYDDLNF